MEEEILELAMRLGHRAEEEREDMRLLCRAAELEWASRLKSGVSQEDCAPAFLLAAAWSALAMLEEQEGTEKFSAGDLSIERGGTGQSSGLRKQAEQVMSPYLQDDWFCFRGVKG